MKYFFSLLLLISMLIATAQAPSIEWQKAFGGVSADIFTQVIKTGDGGYLVAGDSRSGISGEKNMPSKGSYDYWLLKLSTSGGIEWQKSFGGSEVERYCKIIQTADGGYLVAGGSDSNISGDKTENTHGFNDYWVIKLDSDGNIQWQNTIGADYTDFLSTVIQAADGGYLLVGASVSNISEDKSENNIGLPYGSPYMNDYDYWIVKIDAQGNRQWDNVIGSKVGDGGLAVLNTNDGGYLVGGISRCDPTGDYIGVGNGGDDCWILKLSAGGEILWQKTIGGSADESLYAMVDTADGGYLVLCKSESNISGDKSENSKGLDDIWLVKIDIDGNVLWDHTLGGSGNESPYSLVKDGLDNFYIGAVSNSPISGNKTEASRGDFDYWVLKVGPTGNVIWDKTIGGGQAEGYCSLIYNSTDDSIMAGGASLSSISGDKTEINRGSSDYWLVKLASGSLNTNCYNFENTILYPNPTSGMIHIELGEVNNVEITVLNVLGQIVQEAKANNTSKIDIDIKGTAGIYFLTLKDTNNKGTFRIVKK